MRMNSIEGSGPGHLITAQWYSLLESGGKAGFDQLAKLRTTVLAVVAHAIRQKKEMLHASKRREAKLGSNSYAYL